jgi:hypothetical protein
MVCPLKTLFIHLGACYADKKRLREDTEAERQLKKEERARKRKAETEKAAREVQVRRASLILFLMNAQTCPSQVRAFFADPAAVRFPLLKR